MRHPVRWSLVFALVALTVQRGSTQPVRVAYTATEANSQHKLVVRPGAGYLTYTRPAAGTPQVHVDATSDGRQWRALGQVSRGGGPSTLSTLVVDAGGRIHVAWTQFDGPTGRVYYSRRDGQWRTPLRLSPASAYAGYPSMDVDSRDRLHLVWYGIRVASAGQPTAHGGIYEIYYVQNDGRWSQPEHISPGVPDAINPALAVDARDRVHVVWFQSDGRAYQVMYAMRAAAGSWTAPAVLTGGTQPSTKPALAVDRGGRVHVVWERAGGIDYLNGEAGRWTAPQRLAEAGRHPTVGVWPGGVFVLWRGDDGGIRLRAFDGRWRAARRLGDGDYPNATPWRSSDGIPFTVWTTAGGYQVIPLAPELER